MRRGLAAMLACSLLFAGAVRSSDAIDLASFVDPMIGTMGSGFVFPGPAAPYGMVQLSPDTEGYFAYTGYLYTDAHIRGFSHVHVQSMGVPEGGNVPFMPTTGDVASTDVFDYQSPFSHATERAEAGSYRVSLLRYAIDAELTAGVRVGMHRYTFPPVGDANVLLDVGRQIPGGTFDRGQRAPGRNRARIERRGVDLVVGTANVDRLAPHGYAVHFAARFDRAMSSFGTWGGTRQPVDWGAASAEGLGAGAVVRFDAREDRDVVIKVGISFVSVDNALANLEAELPGDDFGFEPLRARTRAAWSDALSVVGVAGGTPADRTTFYTALYHAQHHPNVFNDVNGEYIGHDDVVHRIGDPGDPMPAGSTYFANFSMWDTYRAEMPLLMLIAPDRVRDMMRSLAAVVRWGGAMPRWALMNRNPNYMNGEPALQVISDAACRGLVPSDVRDELYQAARDVALEDRRDPEFYDPGYTAEASNTLEYALGDFALALWADALGRSADRDALLRHAEHWRNLLDPATRFVRPRDPETGAWRDPYYPEMSDGFREGTGWQYTWLVPHDIRGLYDAMGGDATVEERLDTFFGAAVTGAQPWPEVQQKLTLYGIAYYGNQYAPSNEHDLQAPWLYSWLGNPWKTQLIQRAYQSLYRAAPDGLPGNDDLGTMSAWYVWSALGLYPVIPGAPLYTIGSPVFERATVSLGGGRSFTIEAPGASVAVRHVEGASLDDAPLARAWFAHDAIADGGTLRLAMSARPDRSWGTEAPPSQSTHPLSAFACAAV